VCMAVPGWQSVGQGGGACWHWTTRVQQGLGPDAGAGAR
jgi:hypothetical protein